MFRAQTLLFAAMLTAPAAAQTHSGAALPTLTLGRVEDGHLVTTAIDLVPMMRMGTRVVKAADGSLEQQQYAYTVVVPVETRKRMSLQGATVTGVNGKRIPTDQIAELLKDEAVIVVTYGVPTAAKYRRVFKDGTLFVTLSLPQAPVPATPTTAPLPPAEPPMPTPKTRRKNNAPSAVPLAE